MINSIYLLITILWKKVGRATKSQEADYAMETVTSILQVIPEIWVGEGEGGGDDKRSSHVRNEMDSALAATIVGAWETCTSKL